MCLNQVCMTSFSCLISQRLIYSTSKNLCLIAQVTLSGNIIKYALHEFNHEQRDMLKLIQSTEYKISDNFFHSFNTTFLSIFIVQLLCAKNIKQLILL